MNYATCEHIGACVRAGNPYLLLRAGLDTADRVRSWSWRRGALAICWWVLPSGAVTHGCVWRVA